nr:methylmalonyl-CoA mutase [Chloroflexota bacterium]
MNAKERWERESLAATLKKNPERKPAFETSSGIPLERVYGPLSGDPPANVGFPGEYPFTRGVQPT